MRMIGRSGVASGTRSARSASKLRRLGRPVSESCIAWWADSAANVLVQAPVGDRRRARRDDEPAVDGRPLPGVGHPVGVVVDGGRVDRSGHPVMEDDVGGCDEKGKPVLVEGQHHDGHEEEEVGLDRSVPDVNQRRRRGDHADGDDRGRKATAALHRQGEEPQRGQQRHVPECVQDPISLGETEDREADRLGEEDPNHHVMALFPVGLGKRLALRQDRQEARGHSLQTRCGACHCEAPSPIGSLPTIWHRQPAPTT